MKQHCEHISGGANTVSSSVCWTQFQSSLSENDEIIAYCVDNLVAIVDVSKSTVTETLRGHDKRINALKATKNFLVSASEDATVRIWSLGQNAKWSQFAILSGVMRSSIIALSYLDIASGLLIVASDVSGRVAIWLKQSTADSFALLQVVDMPPAQMAHELHLSALPGLGSGKSVGKVSAAPDILLFIGSVDTRIHVRIASQESLLNCLKSNENTSNSSPADSSSSGIFKLVGMLPGHEEWVTCLASVRADSRTLLLASGSKDTKIRLWRICFSPRSTVVDDSSHLQSLDNFNNMKLNDDEDDEEDDTALDAPEGAVELEPDESLSEARLMFDTPCGSVCSVFLEALLIGHEDWVTAVQWMVSDSDTDIDADAHTAVESCESSVPKDKESAHRLYSTSMDRNMVIWAPESPSGVWTPTVRVGDIGGQLGGSVGGNLLGFVSGCLSPDYQRILGIGYGGSFHLWCRSADSGDSNDLEMWTPKSFLSGHFESVNDLVWAPGSEYLVTVSSDQTCRLHAPVLGSDRTASYDDNSCSASSSGSVWGAVARHGPWREVSRPQIHGYDLHSIAIAPSSSSYLLYSSADEKLLRVFDAPQCVIEGLLTLCGVDRSKTSNKISAANPDQNSAPLSSYPTPIDLPSDPDAPRVRRAYIPELGLSNRAAETMSSLEKSEQDARNVQSLDWSYAPLEGQLADYTVWPEVQKMYGHNNGVVCVAISHCGRWLASACKARDRETATVLLWDTVKYCCVGCLDAHDSTVVCLAFSPNDRYIASSGKDRALSIHIASPSSYISTTSSSSSSSSSTGQGPYTVALVIPAAHKRIVWASSWCSDGSLLATGSRDGTCKVWAVSESLSQTHTESSSVSCVCVHSFFAFGGVSVTALAFGPPLGPLLSSWILALGSESGDINYWDLGPSHSIIMGSTDVAYCHGSTVKKLAWTPDSISRPFEENAVKSEGDSCVVRNEGTESVSLPVWRIASCGEDHTVRIFQITQ